MKPNPTTEPPKEGQRVLVLFESRSTGLRKWYTGNYINGRFVEGGMILNSIIGWLPSPPTGDE